jgi:uncharacterized membrane protein YeaQ/YmgE (transglycosylase-associated protein family)
MQTPLMLAALKVIPNSSDLFSCFYYFFSGMIAGTVANYIVRGKMGCLLGNFFLGFIGSYIGFFILNNVVLSFLPGQGSATTNFFVTTVIASITATLISLLISVGLKAERSHQQALLEKHGPPTAQG